MSESGRSCRPKSRRAREAEPYDVKPDRDAIRIELRGRLVRTLVGGEAEEVRRALAAGDPDEVQRLLKSKLRT